MLAWTTLWWLITDSLQHSLHHRHDSSWFVVIGHCTASRSSAVWTFPCGIFLAYTKLGQWYLTPSLFSFFFATEQNRTVCMIICTHSFAYILHMCILKNKQIFFRLSCFKLYYKEEALGSIAYKVFLHFICFISL